MNSVKVIVKGKNDPTVLGKINLRTHAIFFIPSTVGQSHHTFLIGFWAKGMNLVKVIMKEK